MQRLIYLNETEELVLSLPDADTEIMTGVSWGNPCALFTPAYWYTQYIMRERSQVLKCHRIGQTLAEEVAACLLGGHGMPAEVGNAAFLRVRQEGLIRDLCDDVTAFENILCEPLLIGNRVLRYRFWRQKARYLAAVFRRMRLAELPLDDAVALRNTLMEWPGIGPKTASWIVRNWLNSDGVAILDIHIVRAGMLMNLYRPDESAGRHYLSMEEKFVTLANRISIPTSDLDALIWSMMRATPRLVARQLDHLRLNSPIIRRAQAKPILTQVS